MDVVRVTYTANTRRRWRTRCPGSSRCRLGGVASVGAGQRIRSRSI